jgi:hypothetical protein
MEARGIGLACVLLSLAAGCGADKGAGELHAREAALKREVEGLGASVARLERGEPIFPEDAVVVSIAESVVQGLVGAQLPIAVDVDGFKIDLTRIEASFKGSPAVTLTGSIVHKDHPDYVGEVSAIGALDSIKVDAASGTLRAEIAVDHVDLLKLGGLEKVLGAGTVNELARTLRRHLAGRLPHVQIPVKLEQAIELPEVTEGPVRLHGATMPLAVSVADVVAGQGVLWIAIDVVPGELVKTGEGAPR